ncbi:MAG TPA: hypothetical protein VGC97_05105 [Pyrinomonadaceae bacterium]|jgi:hypothetical protein
MKKLILFAVFCLAASINVFGQAKSISEKEYGTTSKEAQSKTDKKIRRETTVETDYRNGKLTRTETISQDYLPPDKSKWLVLEGKGLRISGKTELIYIGDFEYRKENDGAWVKRNLKPKTNGKSDDEDTGLGGGTSEDGDSQGFTAIVEKTIDEYSLEEIKENNELFRVLTKLSVNEQKTETNEYKIWINKNGLITKTTSNIEIKPARMVLTSTATIDYNIQKPKIEAPIK